MKASPGMRLGRYEILAAIGAGGMGDVFRALDTSLGRQVAIKVLPEGAGGDDVARKRFEREVRLLASLSHVNILAIHDFGDEQGMVFAVMELLEGMTLRQRLRNGLMAPDAALGVALAVARGLAAAHAKGIVHRDLKPENIFLPVDGPVKILDFGLARLNMPEVTSDVVASPEFLTQTGVILGTVGYMSPEQLCGLDADAASDVFSFGAVLHEMLTGQRAFTGGSPATIMSAVLSLNPKPLPPPLASADAVVRRCLEKEPERRYRSAQELVAVLEALLPGHIGRPATPAVARQSAAAPRQHPRSIAVLPFADMSPDRHLDYLCEGIAEEILLALTKVEGLRVVARSSAFQFKGTSEDVRNVGRTLRVETVLEGSVRVAGGRLRVVTQLVDTSDGYQLWSERFERELVDVFAVQDEIAGAVAATLRVRLRGASGISPKPVEPHDPETYNTYLKGRHHWNRRTETDLHRSVEYFTDCIERDPLYAQAHAGLAEAYATLGIYGALPPDQAMPAARSSAERALRLGPPLSGALATLGCVNALYNWSWLEAEQQFRRAIDSMPGASAARAWYAMNHLVPLGRFAEAHEELGRALDVDPLSLPIATGLGVRAYCAHRYDEGLIALSNALDLDAGFSMARYFLVLTLAELGRYDEAVREIDTAIRLSGGSPEMTAAAGYALARAGNVAGARSRRDELVTLSAARYVSPGLIAQIHAGLGESDEALRWLERALAVRAADVAWLGVRPIFDLLRPDPRFQALLARVGVGASD
jgi:serine/threonine-protein kinase